jgi:hypothetical protein
MRPFLRPGHNRPLWKVATPIQSSTPYRSTTIHFSESSPEHLTFLVSNSCDSSHAGPTDVICECGVHMLVWCALIGPFDLAVGIGHKLSPHITLIQIPEENGDTMTYLADTRCAPNPSTLVSWAACIDAGRHGSGRLLSATTSLATASPKQTLP